jgi:hypothetical protein
LSLVRLSELLTMTTHLQRRRKISRSYKLHLYFWISFPLLLKNAALASSFAQRCNIYSVDPFRRRRRKSCPAFARVTYCKITQLKIPSTLSSDTSLADHFDNMELWQCGDVDEDLKNLEMALINMNADQNRYHEERLEALNSFAQSRHPIALHMRLFMLQPLIGPFLLAFAMRRLRLVRLVRIVSMVQFWTASVIAPIILLWLVVRTKSKSEAITSCPDASDAKYYDDLSYLTKSSKFWSARQDVQCSNSTSDCVQCLLEQWVSCILGGIVAGMSWLAIAMVEPRCFRMNTVLWVQMLTRWGVVASLHQYPPLWFALNRQQQPRPLSWPVCVTQQLIRSQRFMWFATLDATILALTYPSLFRCYAPAMALAMLVWCSIVQSERWINGSDSGTDSSLRTRRGRILKERLYQLVRTALPLPIAVGLMRMWYQSQSIWGLSRRVLETLTTTRFSSVLGSLGYEFASGACLFIALVGPVCHIAAVCQLFQARFMHNASLSMDWDLFRKSVLGDGNDCSWRWRYRLKWREPMRIGVVLNHWWNRFWYWLFLEGSIDEKLQQESRKLLRSGTSVKSRGLTVWQRAATEPSTYYSGRDRSQWKTKAMERIARKHQYDYDRRSFDVSEHFFACSLTTRNIEPLLLFSLDGCFFEGSPRGRCLSHPRNRSRL